MKCIITFKIKGGQEVKVELENSSPSSFIDKDLVEALNNNPEVKERLIDNIRQSSILVGLKTITLKDLITDGILANCTLQYLRENPKYNSIDFPTGAANILLVKNLKVDGKDIRGRVINSNNEEIFVTNGSEKDLTNLSNFLKIRSKINLVQFTDDSPDKEILEKVKEVINKNRIKDKLDNINDMLLDYICNNKKYLGQSVDGESVISILEPIIRKLKDWSIPETFDNPFINDINLLIYKYKDNKFWISYLNLYKSFELYHDKLLKTLGITSLSKFLNIEFNDEFKEKFIKYDSNAKEFIDTSNSSIEALINYAFSVEPEFNYLFKELSSKGIYLKSDYTPISDKYGISYTTIREMHKENYKGYSIYEQTLDNHQKRVFITKGTLTEKNNTKKYKSIEEAKVLIDSMVSKQFLKKNSLIEFKFRNRTQENNESIWDNSLPSETISCPVFFSPGTIISSLNIPIDSKTNIRGDEQALFNGRLSNFLELVDKWPINKNDRETIKTLLDTPEKVTTFIYKINERLGVEDRSKSKLILQIANDIASSDYNYYYIENKQSIKHGGYLYKVIPTELNSMSTPDAPANKPLISRMEAIVNSLKDRFGVIVNLRTSELIKTELGDKVTDINLAKAFIYNGQIYVNTTIADSTDLLHEYIHLILGILKSNPDLRERYEILLNKVVATDNGQNMFNKLKERYPKLSLMDLKEEVFAKMFSKHIRTKTTTEIFSPIEEPLKNITQSIFNIKSSNIMDTYGKSFFSIFEKFDKDVRKLLSENKPIDFGSIGNLRKISNWISNQIETGNIIEKC